MGMVLTHLQRHNIEGNEFLKHIVTLIIQLLTSRHESFGFLNYLETFLAPSFRVVEGHASGQELMVTVSCKYRDVLLIDVVERIETLYADMYCRNLNN